MSEIATDLLGARVWYRLSSGAQAIGIVRAVYATAGGVRLAIQTETGHLEHINASSVRVDR